MKVTVPSTGQTITLPDTATSDDIEDAVDFAVKHYKNTTHPSPSHPQYVGLPKEAEVIYQPQYVGLPPGAKVITDSSVSNVPATPQKQQLRASSHPC